MGNTNRYPRIPQSTKDVSFDNNQATVVGILGLPLPTTPITQLPNTVPVVDQSGTFWNLLAQLPLSMMDSVIQTFFDLLISAEQGDILFRGADDWQLLPADTDGEVLTTHGAGFNPTWEPAGAASDKLTTTAMFFSDGRIVLNRNGNPMLWSNTR